MRRGAYFIEVQSQVGSLGVPRYNRASVTQPETVARRIAGGRTEIRTLDTQLIPHINEINDLRLPRKRDRSLFGKQHVGSKDAGVEIWYGIDLARR
jgi:hypothetical protein